MSLPAPAPPPERPDRLDRIEAKLDELLAVVGVLVDTFGGKLPAATRLRLAAAMQRKGHRYGPDSGRP